MRIWIFEPSPGWDYCGGMAYAVAETYERAVELFRSREKNAQVFQRVQDIPTLVAYAYNEKCGYEQVPLDAPKIDMWRDDRGYDKWVLTQTYELQSDVPEDVVVNYNYA